MMNERIKELRKKLGLSQAKLANKIGVTPTAIYDLECGKSKGSKPLFIAISAKLNINETWLLTGEGEMFAENPQEDYAAELRKRYALDDVMKELVEAYLESPPETRRELMAFWRALKAKHTEKTAPIFIAARSADPKNPVDVSKLDIAAILKSVESSPPITDDADL